MSPKILTNSIIKGRCASIFLACDETHENKTQPPVSSSEEDRKYERIPEEGEYIPGTYCLNNQHNRQYEERERVWKPRPGKFVLIYKGRRH